MPRRREARPIDATPECKHALQHVSSASKNSHLLSLKIEWTVDPTAPPKRWMVGVWAVERVTADILYQRLMAEVANGGRVVERQATLARIRQCCGEGGSEGDDELVFLDSPSVSLMCPVILYTEG